MKTLILDYSKWRSGGIPSSAREPLGQGPAQLLNAWGFMCCLGQFSPQINKEITAEDMIGMEYPCSLDKPVPGLVGAFGTNSPLASEAARINDSSEYTAAERIAMLRELFKEYGYKIRITNRPRRISK